jgi:hypothetical protein
MRRLATRTLILSFCLISLCALAQDNRVVRVGVAVMQSQASHSMSGAWGQDRLVAALNQQKPDKKFHVKVQGVPLEGTSPEEVGNEAKQKSCDYVVYTNLVELQASTDNTMQPRSPTTQTYPGQTYPGGGLGLPPNNPNSTRGVNTAYRATVDYRLYRAGDAAALSSSSLTGQQSGPEENVVAQVLNQVANRVFAEVKKAPPAAQ